MSMTGQGQASGRLGETTIDVEIRSVNNRFLKVTTRLGDGLASLENAVDSKVRERLRRGTVQVSVTLSGQAAGASYQLNLVALEAYAKQAMEVANKLPFQGRIEMGALMQLPGVLPDRKSAVEDPELSHVTLEVLDEALKNLNEMRLREGEAMAKSLSGSLEQLKVHADEVKLRAPQVIEDYRSRLENKLRTALAGLNVDVTGAEIIREVQIFSDRCDIQEELVRLASHFRLFREALDHRESQGRKLDFLVQELHRETNTIGSKANDASISEVVVNMKTIIEQIRELVQNIE